MAARRRGREPGSADRRAGVRLPRRTGGTRVGGGRADALQPAAGGHRLPARGTGRAGGAGRQRQGHRRGSGLMADIVMPRLSDTMEEGTILRWLKRDGEQVRRGEELVEIETDKATMAYESDQEGILQTVAGEGDTLAVGQLIARVGEGLAAPGAGVDAGERDGSAAPSGARALPGAAARVGPAAGSPAAVRASAAVAASEGERVKASPLARRMARERGVDLHALRGSGPSGRIVKADVQAARSRP